MAAIFFIFLVAFGSCEKENIATKANETEKNNWVLVQNMFKR